VDLAQRDRDAQVTVPIHSLHLMTLENLKGDPLEWRSEQYFSSIATQGDLMNIHSTSTSRLRRPRLLAAALAPLLLVSSALLVAPAGASSLNVTFNVTSVNFGTETVGTTASAQAVVTNTTAAPVYFKSALAHGGSAADFALSAAGCAGALAPGATCNIGVSFTAGAPGDRVSSLDVTLAIKGPGGSFIGEATVKGLLSGHGVAPNFTLSNANAGSAVLGTLATATVLVTNTSAVSLQVHAWNVTDTHHVFSVASSTCSAALNSGASCDFVILFSPKALGAVSATLTVSASVIGAAHLELVTRAATVSGTGTRTGGSTGPISLSTYNAGELTVGTSVAGQISMTNVSKGTVSVLSAFIVGSNAADFKLGSNNCPSNLASAASCQFNVTFAPSQPRVRTANLAVTVKVTIGTKSHDVKVLTSLSGFGVRPTAHLSAPDFGAVTIGSSSSAQVTVTNTSVSPLNFRSATLSGPHMPSWSVSSSTCSGALAPNASCEIGLSFAPHTQGDLSIVLTVMLGIHQGTQHVSVMAQSTVKGSGVEPSFAVVVPNFTATAKGGSTSAIAVVTNTSDVTLSYKSATLSGGNINDFSVTGTTCVSQLAPAASCNVSISFHPIQSTSGARSTTLRIALNIAALTPTASVSSLSALNASEL
jgi:hypothetical protein